MTDILITREMIKRATLGISKGIKNAVSSSIAFSVDILIRNEKEFQRNTKQNIV